MGQQQIYSDSFREQALEKVYSRGNRTVTEVAEELNISRWTLKNWMKTKRKHMPQSTSGKSKRPQDWTRAERLGVLMEAHGLDEDACNALCRERGIFRHHLQQWRVEFEAASQPGERAALRKLKDANKALERELKRKEKALAEAAALLVLKKKYQVLWEEQDG
jgi:transposase-like protein